MVSTQVVLVTGASGYIGGGLVPRLLARGHTVRCLVRRPEALQTRLWAESVQVAVGDVLRTESLLTALAGVQTAYYLVHSMGGGSRFHELDIHAARTFADAAKQVGVGRIVYLGALADEHHELSEHLRSRLASGNALRSTGVPVTEFRAGVIVGSGSASFEMIRYLTERVPVMITPRWVYIPAQPIGIDDVLDYLVSALEVPASAGRIIEIGGSETIAYGRMMTTYAELRGLKRAMLPVPVLTPRLSSYWVNLVTPVPAALARPIIQGVRNESLLSNDAARQLFPAIQPADYRTAVQRALACLQPAYFENTWNPSGDHRRWSISGREGMVVERRQMQIPAAPAAVWDVLVHLGSSGKGSLGWLGSEGIRQVRGTLDRLLDGDGLHPTPSPEIDLKEGGTLDYWRIEKVESNQHLWLQATRKLPGQAWLTWRLLPQENTAGAGIGTRLVQTYYFAPRGLRGWLYWVFSYPLHAWVFTRLLRSIARRAAV